MPPCNWRRVGTGLVLLFASLNIAGMPPQVEDWTASTATFTAGSLYFLALAALELQGFHARLARRWTVSIATQLQQREQQLPADLQRGFAAVGRGAARLQARLSTWRRT